MRRFLALATRACGARVHIRGAALRSHVLYVANHQSWLDILALGGATGTAFVSKAEVGTWPVVGWLARLGGTVFVRRERRSEAHGQADALTAALDTGRPVTLFAEGMTGNGIDLLPFKPALFAAVAGRPGIAVQPVRIFYGAESALIAWTGDEPAGANAVRVLGRAGQREIMLTFLAPLQASLFPDRKALAAATRAAIDAAAPPAYTPRP